MLTRALQWMVRLRFFLPMVLLAGHAPSALALDSLCAVVKLEIQQELTLERQGFDAHMRINNGLDTVSLENVSVNVTFVDENGNPVEATSDTSSTDPKYKFFITPNSLEGISAIDGTGSIAPSSTADIHWLIVPTTGAAADNPEGTLYFVGASLSYTVGGETQTLEVAPDTITVKPLPQLSLDYFLTHDVYANEPFTLGVRVKNNSTAATAHGVSIDSAQPTIVEDAQGLLIDFQIIGASANGQPIPDSLLVDFGDIGPQASAVGRWSMLTTLSGQFTDFTATVAHSDELGGELTSLFTDPVTHDLVHDVLVDLPGRDGRRDFLALDTDTLRVYESSGLDTLVTESASPTFTLASQNGTEVAYTLSTDVVAGFVYAKVTDSNGGAKEIKSVTRSDGKSIPLANVWLSKTPNASAPSGWDYYLNLFDANTPGSYIVVMDDPAVGLSAPVLAPVSGATTYEGSQVSFTVSASDADGTTPALSTGQLPVGATFADAGDGTGTFSWAPTVGQAGDYRIVFTASDGTLSDEAVVAVKVNPAWDTDGDGMDDDWERQYFGDLSRDGTGDFDGDGIPDLLEYQNSYDPTQAPPAAPSGVAAVAGDQEVSLSWPSVTGATTYNIYWSTSPGVSPATGTLIGGVSSPYIHTGLTNDTPYYYVVTAVGAGGESAPSTEVSAVAGARDWGAPVRLEQDDAGAAQQVRVATASNGDGMAVWSQSDGTRTNIWAARYVAGSGWEAPALLDSEDLGDAQWPQVGMDSDGNAVAVWEQSDGTHTNLWANRYLAGSGWTGATLIESSDTDVLSPRVAVDGSGNAAVLWRQADGLWFNRYDVQGGAWGTAEAVAATAGVTYTGAALGVDSNGHVLALWSQSSDGQSFTLAARAYVPGTGWSTVQTVADALSTRAVAPGLDPALAVAGSGEALAIWSASDGTQNNLWVARYSSGSWSAPESIEGHVGDGFAPAIAYGGDGGAVAAWLRSDGTRTSIWANRLGTDGTWGSAAPIETDDTADAGAVQVAADGAGNAFAVWHQGDSLEDNIWAARYGAGSGWEAPVLIDTENAGDARFPALAVAANGSALAVWAQSDGTRPNITANAYAVGNTGVPNIAPVLHLGPDQNVDEGTAVTLGGNVAFDQDGTVASYAWTQTGGPTVSLSGADTLSAGFTAPAVYAPTVLTFQLAVTDDVGAVSQASVQVSVASTNPDDDGDGMDDAWEFQSFGTLTRDGTGDFDADGFTDLVEYQSGTDPTQITPAAPTGVQATPAVGQVTLSWQPVTGATSYNIYWSTSPGVSPATGTLIAGVSSPYVHTGLSPETTYYYIVTAVGDDESLPSAEVSATAGRYAWEVPSALSASVQDYEHLTSAPLTGDTVIAVWTNTTGDLMSALHTDSTGWGTPDLVQSPAGTSAVPKMASDGQGNAVAVWLQFDGTVNNVWASHYTAGVGWGTAELIETNNLDTSAARIAMDDTGNAVVVWRQSDGFWANRYVPGTGWGAAALLASVADDYYYGDPIVAMSGGSALVAWEHISGSHRLLEVVRYAPGGGWGSAQAVGDVATQSGQRYTPSVAMDATGNAIVVWPNYQELLASRYTSGGWQAAEVIGTGKPTNFVPSDATTVVLKDNGAIVAWTTVLGLYRSEYNADSGWSSLDQVTDSFMYTSPSLTVEGNGRTILCYSSYQKVWAATREPNSIWGTPQLLNGAYPGVTTSAVHEGTGGLTAVWAASSGEVVASRYRLFNAPPTAVAGPSESVYGGQSVALDGSGSTDSDGVIQSYHWAGANSAAENSYYANPPEGTTAQPTWNVLTQEISTTRDLQYALVVTDDAGAMVTDITTVTVLQADTDGDGMDDLWEIQHFGNISASDGTADADGDGLTDLQEFEQGGDPASATLAAPTGLRAAPSPGQVSLSWDPVAGATGYNLYWSTQPGVSPASGTLVAGVSSPYVHTGLAVGTTYYYVVTAVNGTVESAPSAEVHATTGILAYTGAEFVEKNGGGADEPDVAVDDNGNAVAVWYQADGGTSNIWANRYTAGTGWGTPVLIESDDTGEARDPSVAMNSNGQAVAVWEQSDSERTRFWANTFSPSTGWGTAQVISSTDEHSILWDGYQDIDVAIDASGNAIAVWRQMNGGRFDIWANRYSPGTGWQSAQTIETDNAGNAHLPRIAMNPDGTAVAVWYQADTTQNNAWANIYTPGSGWGAAQLIENDATGPVYYTEVAIDAAGNAIAAWIQYDGAHYSIRANRYAAGGGWGTPTVIDDGTGSGYFPKLAMDGSGNAIVVWEQWDGSRYNIEANRYAVGTGWGTPQLLETNDAGSAYTPEVAMDASGNAKVVWNQYDPSSNVWANTYTFGSGWGTAAIISNVTGYPSVNARVAMSPTGESVVLWEQFDEDKEGVAIWGRRNTAAGWDSAQVIDSQEMGGAYTPQVAIDGNGNVLAVWSQNHDGHRDIWANRYAPANGWGSGQLLETDDLGDAVDPDIAMNADGAAVAVWSQSDGTRSNIWASSYSVGSGWASRQLLETNDTGSAESPRTAINANGDAAAIWRQWDGTRWNIWANTYAPGSGWGTAELIETEDLGDADIPSVVVDGMGNATAVWGQWDGTQWNVWTNRYEAGVGWGTAQLLGSNKLDSYYPVLACDPAGDATVVWGESNHQGVVSVFASRYSIGSGWGAATLIETDDTGSAYAADVAMDANGNATVVWRQWDGSEYNIMANRYASGAGWGTAVLVHSEASYDASSPSVAVDGSGNAVAVWVQASADRDNILAARYSAGSGWGASFPLEDRSWGDGAAPQVAMNAAGSFVTVWDHWLWTAHSILGNYYGPDNPPTADAGPDQSAYGAQTVTLDGTGSTDGNGTLASYSWSQVSGPPVSLDDPSSPTPSFVTPDLSGRTSVSFVLTVTDDRGSSASDTVTVTVLEADSDGDGLDDLWELQYFGDLSRDGTGDFDGDGLTDLQEFGLGTDPTAMVPATPTGFDASSAVGGTMVSWTAVPNADSYNLYWSTTPGVTPGTAHQMASVTNPYAHTGLSLGQRYYYVVTAVGAGGESAPSAEVSTLAGQWIWEMPSAVEPNVGDAGPVSMDVDAGGEAMAVWPQSDGIRTNIWASHYVAGTGWGVPQLIETDDAGPADNAQVVMDSAGNALAVWAQSDGTRTNIWANRYVAGTGWGAAQLIETDDLGPAQQPRLAVDAAGNALAVWEQSDGARTNIWANRYVAGTGWGTAELTETDDTGPASDVAIAMDSSGNALAVWQQSDGARTNMWANRYVAGTGWGTAELIETDDAGDASLPSVAMDSAGNAVAVWQQSDGIRTNIWANRYVAGTGWGAAGLIETDDTGAATDARVAIDGNGVATAVWAQSDGTRTNIWANRYSAATGWGSARLIETDDGGSASAPAIAADVNGNAVVLWQHGDGTRLNLWANRYRAGAGWGTAQLIESDDAGDALAPDVDLDAQGNALGAWHQWDGATFRIQAVRNVLQ